MTLVALLKTKFALISSVVFSFFMLWWLVINLTSLGILNDPDLFADTYASVALIGGVAGLYLGFTRWGGWKSLVGKVMLLLSCGLLAQVFGQFAYAFYARVLGIEVPYPSVGDFGFYGSMALYIFGAFYLIRLCTGSFKVSNVSVKKHPLAILIPLVMLSTSYMIFIKDYEFDPEDTLVTILDFSAPLLQSLYVSLALVAFYFSKNIVNGIMHKKIIFLLAALVTQYFADFVFLYKAHRELYETAGITDLIYLLAYFLMSLAIINLNSVFEQVKSGKVTVNGGTVN